MPRRLVKSANNAPPRGKNVMTITAVNGGAVAREGTADRSDTIDARMELGDPTTPVATTSRTARQRADCAASTKAVDSIMKPRRSGIKKPARWVPHTPATPSFSPSRTLLAAFEMASYEKGDPEVMPEDLILVHGESRLTSVTTNARHSELTEDIEILGERIRVADGRSSIPKSAARCLPSVRRVGEHGDDRA